MRTEPTPTRRYIRTGSVTHTRYVAAATPWARHHYTGPAFSPVTVRRTPASDAATLADIDAFLAGES